MEYGLPESLTVQGKEYAIRTSYKCALDAFEVLNDPDMEPENKTLEVLGILYVDFADMPAGAYEEALQKAMWYLSGGKEEQGPRGPRLMDWAQDYPLLVAPINRVLGYEVRSTDTHWFTFLGAFYEIGDCAFAQVVNIRNKINRGKKLEPHEKEYLRRNRDLVELKNKYSKAEKDLLARLT